MKNPFPSDSYNIQSRKKDELHTVYVENVSDLQYQTAFPILAMFTEYVNSWYFVTLLLVLRQCTLCVSNTAVLETHNVLVSHIGIGEVVPIRFGGTFANERQSSR